MPGHVFVKWASKNVHFRVRSLNTVSEMSSSDEAEIFAPIKTRRSPVRFMRSREAVGFRPVRDEDPSVAQPLVLGEEDDDDEFNDQDFTDSGQTYNLSEAVESVGFGRFQIKLLSILGFFSMADALEMMLLSILAPTIRCIWHLPPWKEALVTTVVFVGMMFGSSFWGGMADRYGRKTVIINCSCWIWFYGLLSAFSPNYMWIIVLRCLVGFGIGGAPQATTLLAEFMPAKYRSFCIIFTSVFWTLGSCLTVGVAMAVMNSLGWRWLLGILSIPLFIFIVMSRWLPESCRFLLAAGERGRALEMLHEMARKNKSQVPDGTLKEDAQNLSRGRFSDLLSKEYRRTTILLWIIWWNLAFTYYGIVLMTTELYQYQDESGGNCQAKADGSKINPDCGCKLLSNKDYTDMLLTTLSEIPGLIFTMVLIERLGRKITMSIQFVGTAICYFLLFMCTNRTLMTVFISGIRGFISGAFMGFYVYTPEVYPTVVRALGLGCCSMVARIGAMVTPFIAQVLLRVSMKLALTVYAVWSLVSVIATMMLPIETKGRPMQES